MKSIWTKTYERKSRPTLEGTVEADVAVIGAGITGILTAWQLEEAGVHAVVLEADQIGSGQTGNTTAKITSQHGMFCHTFLEKKGEAVARGYVQANQAAVEEYRRLIRQEGIDCDFMETDAYVYSRDQEKLKRETEAAIRLGIPASMVKNIEIPVSCAGAVRFPSQGQFHPLKFIGALADRLTVYEHSPVKEVREHAAVTPRGQVRADSIVFAAHFPFINFPGMYFTRMHQERSYVVALEDAPALQGVYIGDGEDTLSFRQYESYLLLGGRSHRTGNRREDGCFAALKKMGSAWYPKSHAAACWAAQDCITADEIPFIGNYAAGRPYWFVATGFRKWGMSSAMVSSMLLRDQICGRENPWSRIFTPTRFSAQELPQILRDGGIAVKGLSRRLFQIPAETADALLPGQGALVETEEGKAGVYRTREGDLCQVHPVCPHLGCELAWNPEECTWDCPCHGSRFDFKGNLLDGPAQEGIRYE